MRIGPKLFLNIFVVMLLTALGGARDHANGGTQEKNVRCRYKIVKTLIRLEREQMRLRGDCAERQALNMVNSEVDCLADPSAGIGTGLPGLDARLLELERKASVFGERIGLRCDGPYTTPMSAGVDHLCDPPVTDHYGWQQAMECGFDVMTGAADRLFELTYRRPTSGSQTISEAERNCRLAVGQAVRATFRARLRQRAECFRKAETQSLALPCLATVAWPGRVQMTGFPDADQLLLSLLVNLRNTIRNSCGDAVDAMRFTDNTRIVDYTASAPGGASFTSEDLFNRLLDAILSEETNAIARRMFPGGSFCGDGVVDYANGETCDDGNVVSCDGCDRDCTVTACQNGAACGPSEVCDDGNAVLEDGCNNQCQFETCGDGVVQQGLGELCDDANSVDCDGCDSNCSESNVCNNGIACSAYGEQCDDGLGVCISGVDVRKKCVDDANCRGTCSGGTVSGRACSVTADCSSDGSSVCLPSRGCGGTCSGGAKNRGLCATDADCPGKCIPLDGIGQACAANADCPVPMRCNIFMTCELLVQGFPCATDTDCGAGAYCQPSNGCQTGNTDTVGDRCRESCLLPVCGDGTVDPGTDTNGLGGEQCDDGNNIDGDGCNANCTLP